MQWPTKKLLTSGLLKVLRSLMAKMERSEHAVVDASSPLEPYRNESAIRKDAPFSCYFLYYFVRTTHLSVFASDPVHSYTKHLVSGSLLRLIYVRPAPVLAGSGQGVSVETSSVASIFSSCINSYRWAH